MKYIFLFFVIVMTLPAAGQSEFSLYRLNGNLAQSNMLNPAFAPNNKIVIGLPVISSIYVSLNNDGIAFRDVFKTSETDSLAIDTVSLFSKLKDVNRIRFNEAIQLFYLGIRGKKGYLSFAIHQVSETRLNYPGDLVGWAVRGPASSQYRGKALNFGDFYGKSLVYNKISLNYARDITPHLRIGARYNYLLGVAAAESTSIDGSFTMGIDSVSINTGRLQAQMAGIDFFDQDNLEAADYKNYFLKTKNKGMSIDLGATYDLTDKITLSAAVNDLGYITWKEFTRSYEVDPIYYTFRGFDVLDYLNKEPGEEFLQAQLDSLENLYKGTEVTGNKFKTSLTGKFYAGVNFKVLKVNNFSALFYFEMAKKKIDPAISLGYNIQLGRLLNATLGVSYQNGKINNVGAGLALKLTNLQFYVSSDRANSFIYPARAGRADAHLGMNLVFGKVKKKDKVQKPEEKKEEAVEEVETKPEPVVEVKKDSVAETPLIEPAPPVDTVSQSSPVLQSQPEVNLDTTTVSERLVAPPPVKAIDEKRYEVVKQGNHEDELTVSHYVIVGVFKSKANAQRYSELLKGEGYDNSFGYVTDKSVYHVYVFESTDLEKTRQVRDQFRKLSGFQFGQSWVLTVQE
jgi:hypothetical protein